MADGRLDSLQKILVKSVLETTIDQLAIVTGTLPIHAPLAAKDGAGAIMDANFDTFEVHQNLSALPLEEIILKEKKLLQRKNKTGDEKILTLKRLALETSYMQKVLEQSLEEITDFGTFSAIQKAVLKSNQRHKEKIAISETEKAVRHEIQELKQAIDVAKHKTQKDVSVANLELARLKDRLLDTRRATRGELDYVTESQGVREVERIKHLEQEEKQLIHKRDNLKTDIEHEQRVTLEIESFLSDRKTFLKSQLKFWTEKFKADVSQKDTELQDLIQSRENDFKRKLDAEVALLEATKFVKEELERREIVRIAKAKKDLEVRTAIRIQSWWRMTMVRKGYGSYKKRKPLMEQVTTRSSNVKGKRKKS